MNAMTRATTIVADQPLWSDPVPGASAWRSPGFWVACAIVFPVAAVAVPLRALARLV